ELARRHAEAIAPLDLGDVAYAAGAGRAHHTHRLAVVGSATSDVADTLRAVAGGKPSPAARIGRCRPHAIHRVGVLFTGQGSQYPGMGKALFESEPRFRAALERCDALLRPRLGTSLLAVLYGGDDPRLHQTAYAQPALFALEWSLSQLWSSWGLEPAALLGHSLGEYVAATVAGAMSLEDALELVAERGRLMQSLPADGSMATVFAPAADVAAAIGSLPVAIAATNGPRSTVISGRAAVVNDLSARLEAQQVNVRPLRISHASHSALMDPILDRFEAAAARVRFAPTRVAIASNLTGALLPVGHRFDAAYFRRHLRETVRFAEGLDAMLATGCDVFLELGPSPTLASLGHDATFCCALDRRRDDYEAVLDAVGTLYVAGVELDWEAFGRGHAARKVALPRYPFQATAYWMPFSRRNRGESVKTRAPHPLLSRRR
ncbi:MAG TPA: acyltransferase domain-containing protein, partial [Kofleriaceae bacterium]|nr:acyltransferase domain-containing protein [Kofleriaceae bacterium]